VMAMRAKQRNRATAEAKEQPLTESAGRFHLPAPTASPRHQPHGRPGLPARAGRGVYAAFREVLE